MRHRIALLSASALFCWPAGAAPRELTAAQAAAAFGAREQIEQISLSPDGSKVAMIEAGAGRTSVVTVADLTRDGAPKAISRSSGDPERLVRCNWVTDARMLCTVYFISNIGTKVDATRQIAMNSDGSALKIVTVGTTSRSLDILQDGGSVLDLLPTGAPGKVLMTRTFVPENDTGTRSVSLLDGLGVEMVDITSGARKMVESPRPEVVEYISDGHGRIRIRGLRQRNASGYDTGRIDYYYRKADSDAWVPLGRLSVGGGKAVGFNPVAVDRDLDAVYGFDSESGRDALYRIALDGSLKRELVLARPDVDVDATVRIGRQRRVVGASYATDRRQTDFDPTLKKLGASLGKALPGQPLIRFVDASADESKLLMYAGSDVDPGRYYLFDKATRRMAEVLPARPQLADVALASVKSISFPAADGTSIPGYLTLPPGKETAGNLPAIVMPHGGPGARDEWGFDWLAQFYANRGFAVLQPNFRGSTGYGDAWFRENGFKSWRLAIGDVNDGGRWLVKQGIADPARLGIVGWSYGGYAALQTSVLDPDLFKAIVAIAPVTDLETLREEARGYTSFGVVSAFIGTGAHVRQGSPAANAARIKAPVLLFHGTNDLNVGIGESRLMSAKLRAAGKSVELVEFDKLDHQLGDSKARAEMLARSDAFLRKSMGM